MLPRPAAPVALAARPSASARINRQQFRASAPTALPRRPQHGHRTNPWAPGDGGEQRGDLRPRRALAEAEQRAAYN
eukprot:11473140-Alexandrium_andersonii.AAC.1